MMLSIPTLLICAASLLVVVVDPKHLPAGFNGTDPDVLDFKPICQERGALAPVEAARSLVFALRNHYVGLKGQFPDSCGIFNRKGKTDWPENREMKHFAGATVLLGIPDRMERAKMDCNRTAGYLEKIIDQCTLQGTHVGGYMPVHFFDYDSYPPAMSDDKPGLEVLVTHESFCARDEHYGRLGRPAKGDRLQGDCKFHSPMKHRFSIDVDETSKNRPINGDSKNRGE